MGLTDSYAYFLPIHALYQIVSIKLCHNKHTPNCHLLFFGSFSCFYVLYFCADFCMKKGSISAAFESWIYLCSEDAFTAGRKAVLGNLRAPRQNRKSNAPTPSRNPRF